MSSPATTTPTPAPTTTTSNKRAHEDSSSQNAPDAKRPALDPESKLEAAAASASKNASPGPTDTSAEASAPAAEAEDTKATPSKSPVHKSEEAKEEPKDDQGDVNVPDAPQQNQQGSQDPYIPQDESKWVHIRAIISSQEAATVIGKGGENVTLIRRMSAAKCTVSDYARGAVERILTVSGSVDAVAKVCSSPNHMAQHFF